MTYIFFILLIFTVFLTTTLFLRRVRYKQDSRTIDRLMKEVYLEGIVERLTTPTFTYGLIPIEDERERIEKLWNQYDRIGFPWFDKDRHSK